MTNRVNFASDFFSIGVRRFFGVLGSGDSLDIALDFLDQGGVFSSTSSEFYAPIISGSINKLSSNRFKALSLSIRGPGLSSSLPGLYFNFLEDNNSISLSEGLDAEKSSLNFHKTFNSGTALQSCGFTLKDDQEEFELGTKLQKLTEESGTRMIHVESGSNRIYSYSRHIDEMCSEKSQETIGLKRIILVIGKRGMENSFVRDLVSKDIPFFLTPAALPFANLGAHNFLGVWTGNEQFKSLLQESGLLEEAIIFRIGVMKRELLTLKTKITHFDFDMTSDKDNDRISELVANHTTYNFSNEIVKFQKSKNLIALSDNSWSVFSVVQTINEFITEFHVCFDVGSFATIVENYIRPINTLRIHSSFVGKFMGSAVPISIGVSMAEPDVPVLCLLGEGSYASSTSELVTIAQLQLPICLILLSDGSMHSITGQATSQRQHLGALLPPNLTTIKRMRFPDIPSYVIKSRTELTNKLLEWNRKFPILLILEFDPEKYAKNVSLLR